MYIIPKNLHWVEKFSVKRVAIAEKLYLQTIRLRRLGSWTACNKFVFQTVLWLLTFVIFNKRSSTTPSQFVAMTFMK